MPHVRAPRETVARPDADPLSRAEARLVDEWIRPALGEIAIGFGAPAITSDRGPARVHLTLLAVTPASPASGSHHPAPLRLFARFLVTASAATAAEANRVIVALAFAALESGTPDIERDGAGSDWWQALGVPARPALLVRAPLDRDRAELRAPLVREPLVSQWSRSRSVAGRVVGPDDIPIAGAKVEVERAGLTTYSDHRGEFILAGVPTGPPVPLLTITAKGTRQSVSAESPSDEPLLIRIPLPEP